jgi:hypothetical protein
MNPQDALICAKVSDAIYGGEAAVEEVLNPLGFRAPTWISLETPAKDVCAFVTSSDKMNLICFRGTKVFQDWMSDLQSTPVRFEWIFSGGPTIGEIHAGFGHCLEDALDDISNALAGAATEKPLIITGHSLGGALAAMLGACFTVYGPVLRPVNAIYTFGQPRIGLHNFCNTYDRILQGKLLRFVNSTDVVPRVPFRGWDYSDEGKIIHFDAGGQAASESAQWASFLSRTFQSFEDFGSIMLHLNEDVNDHCMTTYKQRVAQNQDQIEEILSAKY